ncbi:MAG: hypothetical protein ACKE8R_05245 [Methylophagaceae bacterium]
MMQCPDKFEEYSWHDNPIHGFRIIEKENCVGDLVLDIDYITEWLCSEENGYNFRIAPADLVFEDITDLVISLDYESCSASMTPPSIHEIRCKSKIYSNGYKSFEWFIEINWPSNCFIKFNSPKFKQALRKKPILSNDQVMNPNER